MEDLSADLSTILDDDPRPSQGGAGTPTVNDGQEQPEPKPIRSARDDLEHVFKEDAKKQAAEKAEPAKEKPAEEIKGQAEKPAQAEKQAETDMETKEAAEAAPKPTEPKEEVKSDGRKSAPPAKFLPDSQEQWRNTPRSVQRDVETMVRDHEAEVTRYRQHSERYETIRPFDELARSSGRDLRESLMKINQVENIMQRNPIAGLNAILQEIGPRKADGQALNLFEVAQHIVNQGPQGYQQIVAQGQPQPQQREDPRIAQMRQQMAEMEERTIEATIIAPFMQSHPRYAELEHYIAKFLESDMVPRSLSAPERLEAAYMMAERLAPSPQARETAERLEPERRADDDFSGSKSIKSAPGSVSEEVEDSANGTESIRESLQKAARRLSTR